MIIFAKPSNNNSNPDLEPLLIRFSNKDLSLILKTCSKLKPTDDPVILESVTCLSIVGKHGKFLDTFFGVKTMATSTTVIFVLENGDRFIASSI